MFPRPGTIASQGKGAPAFSTRPVAAGRHVLIFDDLKAFVVVARNGSFAQAAADLCIAQSALSKRVQRLEHSVGTPLLERLARGVSLTSAGHALLARAQRVVDDMADMERNVSSFVQTPSGEVRIALPQRTSGLLAPPVVERCMKELPLVQLHVLEGTPSNVHGWLMRGEADIALTYNPDIGAGFSVQPFLMEPLFLFASPTAAPSQFGRPVPEAVALTDLADLPLILPRKPHIVRVLVDRLGAGHGIRPNIIFETDGTSITRGMVERGMGVTIFGLSTTWSYGVESGALMAIPFAAPMMNWKMYLARSRKDVNSLAISRVGEIVEQELQLLINSGAWPNARRISHEA